MIVYEERATVSKVATHYTCDTCGESHRATSMEADEFLHVRRVGGYPSHFGDGAAIELDIRDSCQWEMFGRAWGTQELPTAPQAGPGGEG